ncbi:uncharacterized protein LOC116853001 isoform X2 [Odontomachus brunneus]|uniref:uncharacterized protein LOC116853001 isoform X2 n=1 Tax=Odontomachus brunneus TaxID=486640 RepID=UPI0013F22AC0|nr:uncharacterized protein LOC116853001 isoform X2 [Odontomachus brunneus]
MRVVLSVGEEGEEEEDEEEDEEEKKTKELTVKEQEKYTRYYGVHGPAMRPVATTAVKDKSRRPATVCSIFFVLSPSLLLLLLLLLLPVWIPTIVVNASPLHPTPLHKGITLGSYIKYYEAATYDTATLRRHHNRVRRDVTNFIDEQPLILHLKTLERVKKAGNTVGEKEGRRWGSDWPR